MPTWLVVGASAGIGLEMVKQLVARGEKVFATVRSRKNSAKGEDLISEVAATGDVTIIEGVDITNDNVGETLKVSALAGVTIDVVIHNAGGAVSGMDFMEKQSLDNVTMELMRNAFELNTLGPLRMQQALTPQMTSPGGKVAIISTDIASIADNTSGGIYAYRTSKAAVNMVGKGMSCDLKAKGIPVAMIHPGLVATEFAQGASKAMGGMPVEKSVKDVISVIDALSMENTGCFVTVKKEEGVEPVALPW